MFQQVAAFVNLAANLLSVWLLTDLLSHLKILRLAATFLLASTLVFAKHPRIAMYSVPAGRLLEPANDPGVVFTLPDRPLQSVAGHAVPAVFGDIARKCISYRVHVRQAVDRIEIPA